MEDSQNGLLIAALVAIVAVVGLVILFRGEATGALQYQHQTVGESGLCACPEGYTQKFTGGHGGLASCVCHKEPTVTNLY